MTPTNLSSRMKSFLNLHGLPTPHKNLKIVKGPGKGREGARWDVVLPTGRKWSFTVVIQNKNPPVWSFTVHNAHYRWNFSEVSEEVPDEFLEHLMEAKSLGVV
jgi:hypothetical protein